MNKLIVVFVLLGITSNARAGDLRCENVFGIMPDLARLRVKIESAEAARDFNLKANLQSDFRLKRAEAIALQLSFENFDQLIRQARREAIQQTVQQEEKIAKTRTHEIFVNPWVEVARFQTPNSFAHQLRLTADGRFLIGLNKNSQCWILDTQEQKAKAKIVSPDKAIILSAEIDEVRNKLAMTDMKGKLYLWDLSQESLLKTVAVESPTYVENFSADGKDVLLRAPNQSIIQMNIDSEKALHVFQTSRNAIWIRSFTNLQGDLLLRSSSEGHLEIWNIAAGTIVHEFDAPAPLSSSLKFSPDGTSFAGNSGYEGRTVYIWDSRSGKLLHAFNHGLDLKGLEFSPDGKKIAVFSAEGFLRVYDLANETYEEKNLESAVFVAEWTPDGRTLMAGTEDGKVRFWDAPTMTLMQTMTDHETGKNLVFAQFADSGRQLFVRDRSNQTRILKQVSAKTGDGDHE